MLACASRVAFVAGKRGFAARSRTCASNYIELLAPVALGGRVWKLADAGIGLDWIGKTGKVQGLNSGPGYPTQDAGLTGRSRARLSAAAAVAAAADVGGGGLKRVACRRSRSPPC